MRSINRAAIVVRPLTPWLDWAASLDDGPLANSDDLCSVYLVDADENESPDQILRRNFVLIFEEQLASWHLNEDDWPARRTFALFQQWFTAEVVDLVIDLEQGPIEHDD
jgi:hypothetical protein